MSDEVPHYMRQARARLLSDAEFPGIGPFNRFTLPHLIFLAHLVFTFTIRQHCRVTVFFFFLSLSSNQSYIHSYLILERPDPDYVRYHVRS